MPNVTDVHAEPFRKEMPSAHPGAIRSDDGVTVLFGPLHCQMIHGGCDWCHENGYQVTKTKVWTLPAGLTLQTPQLYKPPVGGRGFCNVMNPIL